MWNDIETTEDFLNFSVIAKTVAELIVESGEKPISIGVSGGWGTGKSSMVKMIGESLKDTDKGRDSKDKKYVFLEFNAWLYQGYDDARAALLQAVSDKLLEISKEHTSLEKDITGKIKSFIKRVNWLQVAKMAAPLALGLIPGGAAVGGIAALVGAASDLIQNGDGNANAEKSKAFSEAFEDLAPDLKLLLKENASKSTPQQIEKLRADFVEILKELNITLVVLVDDLDRCLPETAISTLEAMRLLLFVERTAFVIAADEQMIRNSVKVHFSDAGLPEGHVTSYFDKLIQIPLSVPRLGGTEIKAYLVLLFAEANARKGVLDAGSWLKIKKDLSMLLSNAWQSGIPKTKIEESFNESALATMQQYIDIAEQLAPIMVISENINGNPRLIKRFLNNLMIREKVARLNGMTVDFASLVKMQLFERCASPAAFEYLIKQSSESRDGKLAFLQEAEEKIANGEEYKFDDSSWESPFITSWLKLDPRLGGTDVRPLLYLSRDRSLSLAAYDELSTEASEALAALANVDKTILYELVEHIKALGESQAERLLERQARVCNQNQWERKDFVAICHIVEAHPSLSGKFISILDATPPKIRKATFIPFLRSKEWASDMLSRWEKDPNLPMPVKNAIVQKGGK